MRTRNSVSPLTTAILSLALIGCGSGGTAPPEPPVQGIEPLVAARIAEATEAVRSDPGSAARWGRLGEIYDVHRLIDRAIECYDQAAALDPDAWKWDYFAGLNLSQSDQAEAARRFERALSLEPSYGPLWLHAGSSRLLQERVADAEAAFDKLLELDPTSVNARLGLARIAMARNDPEGALTLLDEAAGIAPGEAPVHRQRAQALLALGEADRAREAERLAATGRSSPQAGSLIRQADPVREEMTLREGVSSRWLRDNTLRLLAGGRVDEARARLEDALRVDPSSAVALAESARVMERLGRLDEALELFERAHAVDANDGSTWAREGRLLARRGEDARAISSFRRAVELDADHIGARVEMGLALARTGGWDQAIPQLEEALQRDPSNPAVAAELAWALATCPVEELRQGARARRLARLLCEQSGYQDVGYMDVLAAAQAATGEYERAAETARKGLQLIQSFPETVSGELRERMLKLGSELEQRLALYEDGRPYLSPLVSDASERATP